MGEIQPWLLVYDPWPGQTVIATLKVKIGLNPFVLIITHFKNSLQRVACTCAFLWLYLTHPVSRPILLFLLFLYAEILGVL